MSNNPVINPRPATFYYHNQLPFTLHLKGIRSSLFLEDAERTSQREDAECSPRLGTNTAKHHISYISLGRRLKGGFAAGHLNTYLPILGRGRS
jgi:hypothetical protein